MATTTEHFYTGNGSSTDYSFTFSYLHTDHIKVTLDTVATTAFTLPNTTTVRFDTAPGSGVDIHIYRETDVCVALATFVPGSSIRSVDLNDNFDRALYALQEHQDQLVKTDDIKDGAVTSAKILDGTILDVDINASAAIQGTKISPDFGSQAVSTTGTVSTGALGVTGNITVSGTVDGRDVAADGTKLDGIESGATADQTNAEIRAAVEAATDSNVFTEADHTKLNGIETAATADQTNAEIRAAVEAASDSNVFTDADHTKLNAIESGATGDLTNAEIRAAVEAATDSNVFTDADHTKLNGIETAATADQTITEIKSLIAGSPLDASHLATDSVTTSEIADAELTTLAGMQAGTASKLAGATALTSDIADLNQIDGLTKQTTISDSDSSFPTSGAVVDYVAAQISPLGGLEVIADEDNFPTQPASGVVISISDASGVTVNSSGTSTTARTSGNGSDNVTINNFPSSLRGGVGDNADPFPLPDGTGLLVSSTGSSNIYNYHKILGKEDDIKRLSDDINDFNARYRVGSSNPTSALDDGDLFFNTSESKMLVYNASNTAWEQVESVGNFHINTISSYSGTGGNSATFNGSAYRFVLSNYPPNAEQLLVSINGVVQKPVAGTSQPSEGFSIDGSSIIFSSAPASGSDYFIITIGSTVNIGTPSNNTVTNAILQSGCVDNAKVATDAAIVGSKLADDSIAEVKLDVHNAPSGTDKFLAYTSNGMEWAVPTDTNTQVGGATGVDFNDSVKARFGTSNDLEIFHDPTHGHSFIKESGSGGLILGASTFEIYNADISEKFISAIADGNVEIYFDNTKRLETTSYGAQVFGNLVVGTDAGEILLSNPDGFSPKLKENAGHLEFWTNNTKRMNLSDGGDLQLDDNRKIELGTSQDLQIYFDGSNSKIHNNTGRLDIETDSFRLYNHASSENMIDGTADGSVNIYFNNSKKFETSENGIKLYDTDGTLIGEGFDGGFNFTSLVYVNELRVMDSEKLSLGDSQDFQIYHSNSLGNVIGAAGGHTTKFYGPLVEMYSLDGTKQSAAFDSDASVELFENNVKVFETTSSGCTVTGSVNETSDVALKEDITPLSNSLTNLKQLTGYSYKFKDSEVKSLGLTAQEVEKVYPDLVEGEEGEKTLQYSGLIAPLLEAIKELSTEVETLKTKVATLEAK